MRDRLSLVWLLWWTVLCGCGVGRPPEAPEASQAEAPQAGFGPVAETRPSPGTEPADEGENLPHASGALVPEGQPEPPLAPLPAGTKVLHVGDSFAGALGLPLGSRLEEQGVRSVLKHTDASYLTDWAWDGRLQKMIWRYNPDLVLITLGGNELEIVDPKRRERTVKKIVSVLGDRPCVWIGVPLWKGPQNGLLEVIADSCGPCVYLDTSQLLDLAQMDRLSDGIHPTETARALWADAVIDWLRRHRSDDGKRPWDVVPESGSNAHDEQRPTEKNR